MTLRRVPNSLSGLPIQIDYTARDYAAIRSELLLLADQITPEWTDREAGDIGVTILEAVSYVADILSYQLDRVQNESYLASAQTREAVVALSRLIGYELAPASPATVSMVIQVDRQVTLPAGFTVRTTQDVGAVTQEYQLNQAVTLPQAGYYCVQEDLTRAQRYFAGASIATDNNLVFTAGEEITEVLSTSDGSADQRYIASSSPVCLSTDVNSSISIDVGGVSFTPKTSFAGTTSTDNVFVYFFDGAQQLNIIFGDGINGSIPQNNLPIEITYRINGGLSGNRAGVGSIIEHDALSGVIQVYNVRTPSGGSDPESVFQAKRKAPRSLRTLERCVTLEDFESMAILSPGGQIKAARAMQGQSPIEVDVYVATQGQNPIPTGEWFPQIQNGYGVIGSVGRWLNEKKPIPTQLSVYAPVVVTPYLRATVIVQSNMMRDVVEFSVDGALQELFATVTDEFGEGVPLSAISQTIENVAGVDYVNVLEFHRIPVAKVFVGNKDALDPDEFSVTNITEDIVREKFSLIWLSSTQFYLVGSVSGEIKDGTGVRAVFAANGSTLDVNLYDEDQEATLLFKISVDATATATPPATNNIWEFSVDSYLGNLKTEPYEILVAPTVDSGDLSTDNFSLTYTGGI